MVILMNLSKAARSLSLCLCSSVLMTSLATQVVAKPSVSHSKGAVKLNASLSHGTLPNYASSEVYASIKLTASDFVSEDRAPLNVSLVMDRSSSMAGDKIKQSKLAALALLDQLGAQDRIAIVSYGSNVSVEVPSTMVTSKNRKKLKQVIENMEVGGMTNLSGGFQQGCDIVAKSLSKESVNRVILMSDGQANRGMTEPGQLAGLAGECFERGVSATTIGLGLNYNEDVMTQMAVAGAGNYYFIDDEKAMAQVFEKEATGLSATVAKKAKLVIDLAPGVELLKLHGYKYKESKNKVTINLAEFSSRQHKDILMHLSVSAQKSGERPVLGMSLTYEDLLVAKKTSKTAKLTATVSADEKVVAKNVDRKVYSHAQKIEVAETMKLAMDEYEKGNQEKATQLIEQQRSAMKQASQTYDFEDADLDSYKRVDKELEETNKTIQQNAPSSAPAKKLRKAKKKRSYDIQNAEESF